MADTSIDTFLVTQEKRDLAPATLRAFRSDLHNFRDWWEETRRRPFAVAHLTSRDLRQWQRHRQQVDGVSPRTINRNLSSLRRFCQWAVTEGLLPDDPALAITGIPSEQLSPRFLPVPTGQPIRHRHSNCAAGHTSWSRSRPTNYATVWHGAYSKAAPSCRRCNAFWVIAVSRPPACIFCPARQTCTRPSSAPMFR